MLPFRPSIRATVAVIVCIALPAVAGAGATLYHVDFGTPPHTVGLPPEVGGGPPPRATVTQVVHGEPTVVAGFGSLVDQPCRFDSIDGDYDQVALDLTDLPASDFYQVQCRLEMGVQQSTGRFTLLLDTPAVRTIEFGPDGEIRAFVPDTFGDVIGDYDLDTVLELRVDVDLTADRWWIYLDGAALHTGPFGGATAIDAVRFSASPGAFTGGVLAGIDDITVSTAPLPEPAGCELLGFDDLPAGHFYSAGDVLATGSVFIEVTELHLNTGPCGDPTTSNFVRVAGDLDACGTGQELDLVNANLSWHFGGTVTDVLIPFGEYSGLINLGINGDCRSLPDLTLLDGEQLGGVAIEVLVLGFPGQGCGTVRLHGEVDELLIGGQDLVVDQVAFCRGCPTPARADFEDLSPGSSYAVGESFSSGFAGFLVEPFFPLFGCEGQETGTVAVGNAGTACGAGQELHLEGVNLRLTSTLSPYQTVVVDYGEFDGRVNLQVNGSCTVMEHFAALDGTELGGALVLVEDHDLPSNGCGRLHVVGAIDEFVIGGAELWIDDLRACTDGGDVVSVPPPSPLRAPLLAQNVPNPFNPATVIRFEIALAGEARLTVHDVAGRRVATLIEGAMAPGSHEVRWDGRDSRGRSLASGVYVYRLETGGTVQARRMVMLR